MNEQKPEPLTLDLNMLWAKLGRQDFELEVLRNERQKLMDEIARLRADPVIEAASRGAGGLNHDKA